MARKSAPQVASIFASASFAAYLTAYVAGRKQRERSYSFSVMARSLQLKGTSLLAMVARGERYPQPDLLVPLCRYLGLSPAETEYAEALVGFEKAKTAVERAHYSERLRLLKPLNEDLLLELDTFQLIYHWYNGALLEMTGLAEFRADPTWISRRLGGAVAPAEAGAALELLTRLGLLVPDASGRLVKAAAGFRAPTSVPSSAVRAFHRQMFDEAHRAIETQPVDQRYFAGSTIAVAASGVERAGQLVAEFLESFKKQVATTPGDEVYHVAVQFFRVTTGPG